jgi:hypothetical protein
VLQSCEQLGPRPYGLAFRSSKNLILLAVCMAVFTVCKLHEPSRSLVDFLSGCVFVYSGKDVPSSHIHDGTNQAKIIPILPEILTKKANVPPEEGNSFFPAR